MIVDGLHFPDTDEKVVRSLARLEPDSAIDMLRPYLNGRSTCVQAGGCVGIWPLRLSQLFDRVITFEPEPGNYECLIENVSPFSNIKTYHAALGSDPDKTVSMVRDDGEIRNAGAYYIAEGGDIPVMTIDSLGLSVDLIYLDIEGCESDALIGAQETIRRDNPVIGVEDKGHGGRMGNERAVTLLCREFGYRQIGRPFKQDMILVHD